MMKEGDEGILSASSIMKTTRITRTIVPNAATTNTNITDFFIYDISNFCIKNEKIQSTIIIVITQDKVKIVIVVVITKK